MTSEAGQEQCDYYSPDVARLNDRRCEELKGHAGKHKARVYLRGPSYGIDFVDEWEAYEPVDERYLGEKQW